MITFTETKRWDEVRPGDVVIGLPDDTASTRMITIDVVEFIEEHGVPNTSSIFEVTFTDGSSLTTKDRHTVEVVRERRSLHVKLRDLSVEVDKGRPCGACLHPASEHHATDLLVGCRCGCSRTQQTA